MSNIPKCPLCYLVNSECAEYKKIKGKSIKNIQFINLLDFEVKIRPMIYNAAKDDNIADLLKFVEVYPNYEYWLNLSLPAKCDDVACDYHFNLPVESKKKNINLITIRMLNLLIKKISELLANSKTYSNSARFYMFKELLNILDDHLLMIYKCMLYHRPDIYGFIFKQINFNPFNINLENCNGSK